MSVGFEERINRDNEHQLLTTPPHLFYFTLARHVEKARETHRPNKRIMAVGEKRCGRWFSWGLPLGSNSFFFGAGWTSIISANSCCNDKSRHRACCGMEKKNIKTTVKMRLPHDCICKWSSPKIR